MVILFEASLLMNEKHGYLIYQSQKNMSILLIYYVLIIAINNPLSSIRNVIASFIVFCGFIVNFTKDFWHFN